MATISADQLPTPTTAPTPSMSLPFATTATTFAPPAAASTSTRRRRHAKRPLAVGGLVASLAVAGGVAFMTTRGGGADAGHASNVPASTVETAQPTSNGATATDPGLGAAYTTIVGRQPSTETLDCLAGSVDTTSPELQTLLAGGQLSFEAAEMTFAPFIQCAPDADFLADMVSVSQQLLGPTADVACLEQTLAALDTTVRTQAIALAHADSQTFVDTLYNTVAGCAV
jgi:hypothetical protein